MSKDLFSPSSPSLKPRLGALPEKCLFGEQLFMMVGWIPKGWASDQVFKQHLSTIVSHAQQCDRKRTRASVMLSSRRFEGSWIMGRASVGPEISSALISSRSPRAGLIPWRCEAGALRGLFWAAVQELKRNYHDMDMYHMVSGLW